MHYVYLLKSLRNGKAYIGKTADLKRRFEEHNSGNVKATKSSLPWELVYYEAFKNRKAADNRELKLKHYGQSLTRLKTRIDF